MINIKKKEIYTSYFANVRNLPKDITPIGISVGKNKYVEMDYDQRLAPTWKILNMSQEDYNKAMYERLGKLNAQEIYDSLPDKVALICYEKFNDICHRRMVAEWLEKELDIEVPEYGLKRSESWDYKDLSPDKKGKKRNPETEKKLKQQEEAEKDDGIPEAVKRRMESYKPENQPYDLFNL